MPFSFRRYIALNAVLWLLTLLVAITLPDFVAASTPKQIGAKVAAELCLYDARPQMRLAPSDARSYASFAKVDGAVADRRMPNVVAFFQKRGKKAQCIKKKPSGAFVCAEVTSVNASLGQGRWQLCPPGTPWP